ncbi:hypothetical protein [Metabacillus schmidteae]|uniref:hypothetical protein n=1 Tax=Metabacillus schmidteae TaxID=2730405 RepID=UPI001589032A|nr:hypothetical protein [Metabacillus schmidteae]
MVRGSRKNKSSNVQAAHFIFEAFFHYKTIGTTHEGKKWLEVINIGDAAGGVMSDDMEWFAKEFIKAVSVQRHWERQVV